MNDMNNNMNGNITEKKGNAGRLAIGSLIILMLLGVLIFSLAAAPVSAVIASAGPFAGLSGLFYFFIMSGAVVYA